VDERNRTLEGTRKKNGGLPLYEMQPVLHQAMGSNGDIRRRVLAGIRW